MKFGKVKFSFETLFAVTAKYIILKQVIGLVVTEAAESLQGELLKVIFYYLGDLLPRKQIELYLSCLNQA